MRAEYPVFESCGPECSSGLTWQNFTACTDWQSGVEFIDFRQGFLQKIAIMTTIKTKTTI